MVKLLKVENSFKRMTSLKNCKKILKSLREVSEKIASESIDILQELNDQSEDQKTSLVTAFLKKYPAYSTEEALDILKSYCINIPSDAETVLKELDSFSENLLSDEEFEENAEKYPFLYEVWSGDSYDKTQMKGLEALLADLNGQLSVLDQPHIIKRAKEQYER